VRFRVYILVVFLAGGFTALAQQRPNLPKGTRGTPEDGPGRKGSRILDDTTKQVYGPRTSKYYYEEDVFYNRNVIYQIDTAIRNFHRFNYVQRHNNFYQDLGTISTAIRPIFYQVPETIGARSGFDAYDLYWDSDQVKYYDTKSPYSNMNLVLGGRGRSFTKALISRNVNPRWNVGIDFRGLFIDKQIPLRRGKGDRITRSNYYDFYTAYNTKDSVYRAFVYYRRMFHRVAEPGGVKLSNQIFEAPPGATDTSGYFSENAKTWLSAAESNDLRSNFHLSHQYKVGQALQVYHILDRYRQKARYHDSYKTDALAYDYVNMPGDSAWDWGKFKVVRNEVGVKGNLLKLFYNGYYAMRRYSMTYNHLPQNLFPTETTPTGTESYVGGRMELRHDSIGIVNGWAEVNSNGNYRLEGSIQSKWFEATARQVLYKASFMNQAYYGKHHAWDMSFADVESSQLNGYLHYRSRVFKISPGVTFTRIRNYIFFQQDPEYFAMAGTETPIQRINPMQSSGNQIMLSPEVRVSLTFLRHITLTTQAIQTNFLENTDNAIRVPELFVNSQLAYDNIHFNGNLDMQAGVDVHWHSAYFAPAYDPAIRQFYNQDYFKVNEFPLVDIFFNAKIKRGRIFVKYHNLVQAFTKSGYFPTPIYPGQRNVVDFGFDWSFYD
jgi:hypothetical protein